MQIKHVVDIGDFPWPVRKDIYDLAALLKKRSETGWPKDFFYRFRPMRPLRGLKCLAAFWESSTRTAISFVNSARDLGMEAVDFIPNFGEFSSVAKGEDVRRTMRIVGVHYDLIVMRHDAKEEIEAPKIAVAADREFNLRLSIVNGGDGAREHPSQALLDEFTIFEKKGDKENLTVALIGDVYCSRTIHSLAEALADHKHIKLLFISPDKEISLPSDIYNKVSLKKHTCHFRNCIRDYLSEIDVYYFTRYQRERRRDQLSVQPDQGYFDVAYGITNDVVSGMKKDALVLHPMPIRNEIPKWFDKDSRAYYYQQSDNGYFVRAALLLKMFRDRPAVKRFFSVIGWEEKY